MTPAQEQIAALSDWITASSKDRKSPLGDRIPVGPWAVLIPQSLDAVPGPELPEGNLPLWIPEEQAVSGLPPTPDTAPENQDVMIQRLNHLVWIFEEGRFTGALVGLTDPQETLLAALQREMPGYDLSQYPVLFIPLWALATGDRQRLTGKLPLVP